MKSALELSEKYGKPWESTEAYHRFEREHMTLWRADTWWLRYKKTWASNWFGSLIPVESLPLTASEANAYNKPPFSSIYCNRSIIEKLDLTFLNLAHLGLLSEIKTFDGCFNVRKIRGRETEPDAYSIHSFGLALDFNAADMPLGSPSKWSPQFVAVWRSLGWDWGGDWDRIDAQHFQCTEI